MVVLSNLFWSLTALAAPAPDSQSLGSVANTVNAGFSNLGILMTAGAYVIGIGLAVAAVLKFKQHREHPTQVHFSTPFFMMVFALVLIFMPTLLSVTGHSVFGQGAGLITGPSGYSFY